jgi:undecaprenyl phosphate N,N'-diacetylbacillosamine 1-phosphate transferase
LLVEYLGKFKKYQKKRHNVKPGITGLAQISASQFGLKSWKKSIELDILYTRNVSFLLDMIIIFKTIKLILLKKKQYNDFKKFSK